MSKEPTYADKTFDVTPKEREVIEWRHQRRMELRHQYQKEVFNPHTTEAGYVFDPQVQRHYTANFAYEKLFRPTIRNFVWMVTSTVGVVTLLSIWIKKDRDAKEHRYRTGQISYRDRDWKFC